MLDLIIWYDLVLFISCFKMAAVISSGRGRFTGDQVEIAMVGLHVMRTGVIDELELARWIWTLPSNSCYILER